MSQDIYIPPSLLIGKTLTEQIAEHNARVERIWLTKGSNCKPAPSSLSPSTVHGAGNPSRVPAAGHGGSALEVLA